MKSILASLCLAAAGVLMTGCESDVPPSASDNSGAEKLRRGVTGQGTLVQPDRSEDPLIREQSRVGY
jgi:hypothetical protein